MLVWLVAVRLAERSALHFHSQILFFLSRLIFQLLNSSLSLFLWSSGLLLLQHQRPFISCDNETAVSVINSGSTKDLVMQQCLRQLWFISAIHDCELRARHIPGNHNLFVDALSSWHIPSSQAKFAELPIELGISYSFHKLRRIFVFWCW